MTFFEFYVSLFNRMGRRRHCLVRTKAHILSRAALWLHLLLIDWFIAGREVHPDWWVPSPRGWAAELAGSGGTGGRLWLHHGCGSVGSGRHSAGNVLRNQTKRNRQVSGMEGELESECCCTFKHYMQVRWHPVISSVWKSWFALLKFWLGLIWFDSLSHDGLYFSGLGKKPRPLLLLGGKIAL